MTLTRRSPTRDIVNIRDTLDRFFDERFFTPWTFEEGFKDIPVDVVEAGNDIKVKASVPGVKPTDLHVEVTEDRLHIWGETKEEKEQKEENYYIRERRYGRLERIVTLPYAVDSDKAKAEFKDGVLNLTLPKTTAVLRKEIKILS